MRWLLALAFLIIGAKLVAAENYLALGDSYTIGEAVDVGGRWPVQLAQRLHWDAPTIVARTGWTTDELAAAMDATDFDTAYAHVSLLIGVNNQYRGRSVANYASEFRTLLDRAITLAGNDARRVFVVSIPDWGATAFAANDGRGRRQIGREIDAYNAAAEQVCASRAVRFIDITPSSRDRGDAPDMLAEDGLHPSASQYARWVDMIEMTLSQPERR